MSGSLERWSEVQPLLEKITETPWMGRRNGFAAKFYVVSGGPVEYRFYAKLSVWNFIRLYQFRALYYYFSVWVESVVRAVIVLGVLFAVAYLIHIAVGFFR